MDVSSASNTQYDDLVIPVVYSVQDLGFPASSAPDALQFTPQGGANSLRVFKDGTRDEVDHGEGDRFWSLPRMARAAGAVTTKS